MTVLEKTRLVATPPRASIPPKNVASIAAITPKIATKIAMITPKIAAPIPIITPPRGMASNNINGKSRIKRSILITTNIREKQSLC